MYYRNDTCIISYFNEVVNNFSALKYQGKKNWQTFMDNTWDGKPFCVGALRFKAQRQGLPIFYAFPLKSANAIVPSLKVVGFASNSVTTSSIKATYLIFQSLLTNCVLLYLIVVLDAFNTY